MRGDTSPRRKKYATEHSNKTTRHIEEGKIESISVPMNTCTDTIDYNEMKNNGKGVCTITRKVYW